MNTPDHFDEEDNEFVEEERNAAHDEGFALGKTKAQRDLFDDGFAEGLKTGLGEASAMGGMSASDEALCDAVAADDALRDAIDARVRAPADAALAECLKAIDPQTAWTAAVLNVFTDALTRIQALKSVSKEQAEALCAEGIKGAAFDHAIQRVATADAFSEFVFEPAIRNAIALHLRINRAWGDPTTRHLCSELSSTLAVLQHAREARTAAFGSAE